MKIELSSHNYSSLSFGLFIFCAEFFIYKNNYFVHSTDSGIHHIIGSSHEKNAKITCVCDDTAYANVKNSHICMLKFFFQFLIFNTVLFEKHKKLTDDTKLAKIDFQLIHFILQEKNLFRVSAACISLISFWV